MNYMIDSLKGCNVCGNLKIKRYKFIPKKANHFVPETIYILARCKRHARFADQDMWEVCLVLDDEFTIIQIHHS